GAVRTDLRRRLRRLGQGRRGGGTGTGRPGGGPARAGQPRPAAPGEPGSATRGRRSGTMTSMTKNRPEGSPAGVGPQGSRKRDVGSGIYWALKTVVLGPGIRRLFRPIEVGVENVPATGAAIVASKHLSYADWLFLPLALDRRITFVAKSDYFTGAGLKGWA